ncbi:MAG: type II toxin-antitoxin system RelE/ParE family toxin [Hyphomonadaceae bacterium]|nr:type II toxin-antitoxin system RelE/ParE family toxin [Hyphomonadaceae bacterium]
MKVVWRRAALADVGKAILYVVSESPSGATEIARRLRGAQTLLEQWPEIGRPAGSAMRRILRVNRTPYFLVYELRADRLVITAVIHHRENRR